MTTTKWTAPIIVDALREVYLPGHATLNTEEWAFLTEVQLRSAGGRHHEARTIDVFLVRNWGGGTHGHERIAIEVKVSKSDYRNETDLKRAPAEASAHRCAYAAPAGLIDPDTLPDGWGLLEVHAAELAPWETEPRYVVRWRVNATRRTPTADPDYLISAGFRRASRAEERIRRSDTPEAEVIRLRAEVESLRASQARAVEARDREIARAKAARGELMALAGTRPVCEACGLPLTWRRGGTDDSRWVHKDSKADWECYDQRRAAARVNPPEGGLAAVSYQPTPAIPA